MHRRYCPPFHSRRSPTLPAIATIGTAPVASISPPLTVGRPACRCLLLYTHSNVAAASYCLFYFPLPPLLPVASHPHQPPIAHAVIILPYHNPCCCSLLLLPPLLLLQPHLASSFVITAIAPICRLQPHPVAPSFASCSPTQ
ncbi:hypothetical protein GW17_00033952 [Ensete ventricosum]|nr:hypothetical protein GW17_00033952 [Ensete ventricosum]